MAFDLRPLRPAAASPGRCAAGAAALAAIDPDSMLLSLAVAGLGASLLRPLDAPEAIGRSFVRWGVARRAMCARALSNPARRRPAAGRPRQVVGRRRAQYFREREARHRISRGGRPGRLPARTAPAGHVAARAAPQPRRAR